MRTGYEIELQAAYISFWFRIQQACIDEGIHTFSEYFRNLSRITYKRVIVGYKNTWRFNKQGI